MKNLAYFTAVSLAILLSACDMETATEETAQSENEQAVAPSEPASPYYALRPADDKWPTMESENTLSESLLAANYYIVLDGSGSMEGGLCAVNSTKMNVAKKTITQFAQQIPADANIALLAFDKGGASQRVALAVNNREQFFNQVNAMQSGGVTPLKSALTFAYQKLQKQAVTQLGYGEYHLVVVTDGIATANEVPDQIVQTILQESPVVIHSIGFCIDENHSLNQPGMTFYTAAGNAEELQRGLQAVLAESPDFNSDHF
jgi:Mg-chelatase subunit ChlD